MVGWGYGWVDGEGVANCWGGSENSTQVQTCTGKLNSFLSTKGLLVSVPDLLLFAFWVNKPGKLLQQRTQHHRHRGGLYQS